MTHGIITKFAPCLSARLNNARERLCNLSEEFPTKKQKKNDH